MFTKLQIKNLIPIFAVNVQKNFDFLESKYDYSRGELEKRDFRYPQDAYVAVPYLGNIGIEVIWAIADSDINVVLIELKDGKIPNKISFYGERDYGRAIKLDSLVDMLDPGKTASPLPQITPNLSFAETERRVKKSTEMINNNIDNILEVISKTLEEIGSKI
jgi:hypothetical protein